MGIEASAFTFFLQHFFGFTLLNYATDLGHHRKEPITTTTQLSSKPYKNCNVTRIKTE